MIIGESRQVVEHYQEGEGGDGCRCTEEWSAEAGIWREEDDAEADDDWKQVLEQEQLWGEGNPQQ